MQLWHEVCTISVQSNQKMNNMERIKKDYGYLVMDGDRIYDYEGGQADQGVVYKDMEAFRSGMGICYISESGLDALHEKLTGLEARYENINNPDDEDFLPDKEYEEDREDILANCGETRRSIIAQIRGAFQEDYLLTEKQIEYLAECALNEADWSCIQTLITNDYWIDDAIDFGYDGGIFTHHQYEAIMNDMTPLEFGDRQLSYGELAVLDDEFDGAFKVDEDCEDDWSETGLGTNARIAYIEDRRTGRISGPEEFDCPERFRK